MAPRVLSLPLCLTLAIAAVALGSITTCDHPVRPANQAPTASAGGPYGADATVTFSEARARDPDDNLPLTFAWNFGDGTTGSGLSPTKTYTAEGVYTATLVVTDALGVASAPASASVTIANVAPTVSASADDGVEAVRSFQLNAVFTDDGGATDAPWAWTIAWGDGATKSGSATSPGSLTASHTYDAAGSYTVELSVTDKDGGTGTAAVTVVAAPPPNQAPRASAGGPYAADATVELDGAGSNDPDNNLPLTYAWSFGDGTTGSGVSPTRTYETDGRYTATLVVTDARGLASAPASATVTIANVAPAVTAGPNASVRPGSAFDLKATFTDPGGAADAPWRWTVTWGDGASLDASTFSHGEPITATHAYSATGVYTVTVTVTDKDGGVGSDAAIVTVSTPGVEQIFAGAGNIAACSAGAFQRAEATARLLDASPGTVFTAGDNAFPNGTLAEYQSCYDPTWGRHKARTFATLGNHEYNTGNANGSFDYFGDRVGPRGLGYYSYDLGDWHVIHLNDNTNFVAISPGSAQDQWLVADLAATTKPCIVAIWHTPLFLSSNAGHTENSSRRVLWNRLYAAGADVVINAQQHHYERFAPLRPDGTPDPQHGLREFIVGTGGESIGLPTITIHPSSEARGGDYGVLKLTLSTGGYTWEFIPIQGATFTDAGSGSCHGKP